MNDQSPPPDHGSSFGNEVSRSIAGDAQPRFGGLVTVFTATTFLSALLLFSIQPLFAKMVLPVLGGSPSVWAVAVFFFQMALLVGYCYAHILNSRVPIASAGYVHVVLCAAAVVCLPLGLPAYFGEPPPGAPYLWQISLFAVAIGLPFVAVSANAPLLQAWFARTGHPAGRDPYFLYAASNLGSLIALLGYPLVLEPAFGLRQLSVIWTGGYVLLVAALAGCFWLVRASQPAGQTEAIEARLDAAVPVQPPTWAQRLGWVGLAVVPSALLTAFTTHVTTDVASAPLLWVIPLALYLLTFVLVFRERALIPSRLLLILHLCAVIIALVQLAQTRQPGWLLSSTIGVSVFFLTSMVAHRTLYEARPPARYLTEFYLWMSLGGALGGLFAALVAPIIFSEVFEYPLLLALSMACRPGALDPFVRGAEALRAWLSRLRPVAARDPAPAGQAVADVPPQDDDASIVNELLIAWLIVAAGLLAILWLPWVVKALAIDVTDWRIWIPGTTRSFGGYELTTYIVLAFAVLMLVFYRQPPRQLAVGLLMFSALVLLPSSVRRGDAQRSYFGVYRVQESGEYNLLTHGTTLHGAQRVRDADGAPVTDTTPATYYHPRSPMARSIELVRAALEAEGKKGRYGVIGLGSGSLGCFSKLDERWRIFEIDPVVVGIASSGEHFTFLPNCLPNPDIVIGDARLTLAKEPDESFDLIIVDAFSSDAVPVHLMTAEALRLYKNKLTPTGVVLLHISNRYLDLDSVLGATAPLVPELSGFILSDDESFETYEGSTSTVAVFSKSAQALEAFKSAAEVSELDAKSLRAWTDDYSDILGPFLSRRRGN